MVKIKTVNKEKFGISEVNGKKSWFVIIGLISIGMIIASAYVIFGL